MVRRDPKPDKWYTHGTSRARLINPYFFWKRCAKCGDDIKQELIWKVEYVSQKKLEVGYVCTMCVGVDQPVKAIETVTRFGDLEI